MKRFHFKLSVKLKLHLYIIIGIIVTISVITIFSIQKSRKEIDLSIEKSLIQEIHAIHKMFEREHALKLEKVKTDLRIVHELFYKQNFEISNKKYVIEVENQNNSVKHKTSLNEWFLNGKKVHEDFSFVDKTYRLFGGTTTIFQKSDSGYVRISTTVPKLDGSRALNTFIPFDSPVVQTTEKGNIFYGRAYVVNDWYITAYEPIKKGNDIVGMLYVGDKEKDLDVLQKILSSIKLGKSGYIFAFDKKHNMIMHPNMMQAETELPDLLESIHTRKKGILRYFHPDRKENTLVAFDYFPEFELYIAASINEKDETNTLVKGIIYNSLLLALIMIIIFSVFTYYVTTDNIHSFLEQLEQSNLKLASAQKEIRSTEQKFRALFNNSSDEIFVSDLYGNILLVNDLICKTLGYTKEELTGMHFRDLKTEQYYGSVDKNLDTIRKLGKLRHESEHVTKSGKVIPVEMKSKIIDFDNQRAILTISRDITERKEIEDKILRTIISTEEKERKRFAADLHDDLAPILSTIKLYSDLLKKDDLKNLNKADAINNIDELVEMALRTTKEISNNIRPNILQDFGLAAAVNEFCNFLKQTKSINISLSTENYKIEKRGIEESILYQAVKELINNTLKHAKAEKIKIDLKSFGDQVILYYRDDGIGFDIKEATSSKSGLGIYNILNKIKTINGSCDMHSEKGKGMFIIISIKLKMNN